MTADAPDPAPLEAVAREFRRSMSANDLAAPEHPHNLAGSPR